MKTTIRSIRVKSAINVDLSAAAWGFHQQGDGMVWGYFSITMGMELWGFHGIQCFLHLRWNEIAGCRSISRTLLFNFLFMVFGKLWVGNQFFFFQRMGWHGIRFQVGLNWPQLPRSIAFWHSYDWVMDPRIHMDWNGSFLGPQIQISMIELVWDESCSPQLGHWGWPVGIDFNWAMPDFIPGDPLNVVKKKNDGNFERWFHRFFADQNPLRIVRIIQ